MQLSAAQGARTLESPEQERKEAHATMVREGEV